MSVWTKAAVVGAAMVSWAGPVVAEEITLAAGAGYRRPIAELAAAYEKQSGDKLLQVYGHMSQVLAQARESSQIVLVCGDKAVLEKAEDLGFAQIAPLGIGRLVIAYRKGLTLAKPEDIAAPEFKRIGIPDQASAVYGKAGRQFLERSGLAATVASRLVPVATVPQVTSYVASGEVDAGFVNATDAIGAAGNIGGHVAVDSRFYDPVEIVCGVRATAAKVADGFVQFLGTEQARTIMQRHGL